MGTNIEIINHSLGLLRMRKINKQKTLADSCKCLSAVQDRNHISLLRDFSLSSQAVRHLSCSPSAFVL